MDTETTDGVAQANGVIGEIDALLGAGDGLDELQRSRRRRVVPTTHTGSERQLELLNALISRVDEALARPSPAYPERGP